MQLPFSLQRKHLPLALLSAFALAPLAGHAHTLPACAEKPCAFLDRSKTPRERAADLVSRMTLEEKARQLGNDAPAIPRLGVVAYNWWNEGLHGVARTGFATVFPQAVGMAAAWDEPLIERIGDIISTEFRAKYQVLVRPDGSTRIFEGLNVWSPNINIFRDPRWGRGQETYGEDPYLTSRMGIGFIKGLQGNDPAYFKTIATAKHFAVHSGPESNRHRESVYPSPHDLEDTYLPAFRASVIEGKVQSFMCAYNAVNGVPACASEDLMEKRLRQTWGFKGFVVSDCGGAANIYRADSLHYTKTPEEGVAAGFKAGMDLVCGDYRNSMTTEVQPIINAVNQGLLPEAVINRSLERLFEGRIRLGMFDPKDALPFQIARTEFDTPAHRAVALQTAQESMVLLKNDGLLPLKQAPRTIAVIGPNADSYYALVGNYNGTPSNPVTVLDGIRARFASSKVVYVQGTGLIGAAEVAVPDAALCADSGCKTPGLKAEEFANDRLEGPGLGRLDQNARVSWSGDKRTTSTRWTGYLKPSLSGEHQIRMLSDSGFRVWISDTLVTDQWRMGDAPSVLSGKVALSAGQLVPIRIEAVQHGQRGKQLLVWSEPGDAGAAAIEAARSADLVVFVGGLTAQLEGEENTVQVPGFFGGDRTSLDLPLPQQQLLERLSDTGKPIALVLMSGSALSVNWADRHIPAIIQAWYPGGEGGHAVAGLIAGDYSPAGRLPVTVYKSADQLPAFNDYRMDGRTYRYFKGEALYPFGHGLSYTTFGYKQPRLSATAIKAGASVTVSVDVTNTGKRAGDEVVQLYVAKPHDSALPTLAGFRRIHLKAGQTRRVDLTLDARRLSQVDAGGTRKIVPGQYLLHVGGGQPRYAKSVRATLRVSGAMELPK